MPATLSYYGSKTRLARSIIAEFPTHHCYVEACAGSAAVMLRKPHSRVEVLNDRDSLLVNFYEVLRTRTEDLQRALRYTPYGRAEHARCREAILGHIADPVERARCYFVAACQSYAGLVGDAFSRSATKRMAVTWRDRIDGLHRVAARFRPVAVENLDVLDLITKYDSSRTLFYVDPPSLPETRTGHARKGGKYRFEMTYDDHAAMLTALKRAKGKVLLSGYDSPLYATMLKRWRVVWRKSVQQVSATTLNGREAQRRTEFLYANV